ncbi:PepSY domain-containing protein [Agarilytica rhodophyticola]|uniref:PepSY domain-containing protein n=1 Tax=Agarilytica rhodophyticola TaxID=1737490 RepID=UPI000B345B2C|nr:PepSY domain-containing protein [Agarilytica rhodophyticola]
MKLFKNTKQLGKAVALTVTISTPCISIAQSQSDENAVGEGNIKHLRYASLNDQLIYRKASGKSQAAAQAQSQYGGKVLSVNTSKRDGRTVYRVKLLLDSGRIKIVSINGG